MTTLNELLLEIDAEAGQRKAAVRRFAEAVAGIELECDYSSSSDGTIGLHFCDHVTVLRQLRPLADGNMERHVFPRGDTDKATVSYTLRIAGTEVVIYSHVNDFKTLLAPGATCKRVPMVSQLECSE